MSKSTKVKYPTKREIRNQINNIIDQSHMFEVDQSESGYVQCRRVKRSFFSSNAATVLIAVAACVIVVLCVAPLLTDGVRKSTAHGNPAKEESTNSGVENSTQPVQTNTNSYKIEQGEKAFFEDGDLYNVYLSYLSVKATVDGKPADYISRFYEARKTEVWNTLYDKYVANQESMTETDLSTVYVTNGWGSNGVNAKNIVGINNTFNIRRQYKMDDTGHSVREDEYYVHVDTFNLKTEYLLTWEQILKDYDAGLDIIAEAVYAQVKEQINAGITGITQAYMSKEGIREALEESCSWELGAGSMIIYCNGFRTYEETNGNTSVKGTTYESFILPYEKYDIIIEDYAD